MQVSVTVIARDMENSLKDCLTSARSITDDLVVVVDDRSADKTLNIAKIYTPNVFVHSFINFSQQHIFADSKTKYDWILSLDADETLTPELISELKSLPGSSKFTAFRIPRKNKIFGKIINHSNWDPDGIIRLYRKKLCSWQNEVHEHIVTPGIVGRLSGSIYHDNYRNVSEFITKQNHYSSLASQRLYQQGQKFNLGQAIWAAFYDFFRRFIWHGGWLDGWHGLYLAYLMSIYHFSVWIKLWQKQNLPET